MGRREIMLTLASLLACMLLASCTPEEVAKTADAIDALGEITLDSGDAIEDANAQYDALSEEQKQQIENYALLDEANERYAALLYAEIAKALEESNELEDSYFAQYYDVSALQTAKDKAQSALNASETQNYRTAYAALSTETESLKSFIAQEAALSYSAQTTVGEFPFMVDESNLPDEWSLKPIALQTSTHPEWIVSEQKATDLPKWVIPFIDGSGREYTFTITQVPTTEIAVEDENGQLQTAYVNTELKLEQYRKEEVNRDPNRELNERPGYFFSDKSGNLILALQNYDGEDHYVLYR